MHLPRRLSLSFEKWRAELKGEITFSHRPHRKCEDAKTIQLIHRGNTHSNLLEIGLLGRPIDKVRRESRGVAQAAGGLAKAEKHHCSGPISHSARVRTDTG